MLKNQINLCDLTILILTLNEEIHIARSIDSALKVAKRVIIIDSGSIDNTCCIADKLGVDLYYNPFLTHARQLNWALDNTMITTRWVMKLDADEYLTQDLIDKLPDFLNNALINIDGFTIGLRRIFMGQWLQFGSLYPINLLRIWRFGSGRAEDRLMDEHVRVNQLVQHINADFVDHNLNFLSWWTDKHNKYSSLEAILFLNQEFNFFEEHEVPQSTLGWQANIKRLIKKKIYFKMPTGFRALAYFIYRYFFRLGFLDGGAGNKFHILQGFWYRYLVDAKIDEVKHYMKTFKVEPLDAIKVVLGIDALRLSNNSKSFK